MLYRAGRIWTQQPIAAFDHDFPSWVDGVIIPHGIYDVIRNRGRVNIGVSRDTGEFACEPATVSGGIGTASASNVTRRDVGLLIVRRRRRQLGEP